MRGKLVILASDGIWNTSEFKNDMEWGKNGQAAMDCLATVTNKETFDKNAKAFKDSKYPNDLDPQVFRQNDYADKVVFTEVGYYNEWSSSYLYIKNLTDKDVPIQLTNEAVGKLPKGMTCSVVDGSRFDIENPENIRIFGEDACEKLPEPEPPQIEQQAAEQPVEEQPVAEPTEPPAEQPVEQNDNAVAENQEPYPPVDESLAVENRPFEGGVEPSESSTEEPSEEPAKESTEKESAEKA